MCTSIISRGDRILIGMNFDNNGMKYTAKITEPGVYTVLVDAGFGKYPSFGVRADGTFANNLIVDSNGKGEYRRPSKYVTTTTKLVSDVLSGKIASEEIGTYLDSGITVVNTPAYSTHNMITDHKGNVWIVEPGRGIRFSPRKESAYCILTNVSALEAPLDCARARTAKTMLDEKPNPDVTDLFGILSAVSQSGEWETQLSMVYDVCARRLYTCTERQFDAIEQLAL